MNNNNGNNGGSFDNFNFDEVPQNIQPEETPLSGGPPMQQDSAPAGIEAPAAPAPGGMPGAAPEIPGMNPEEAFLNAPPPELTGDLPPIYEESKTKYFIIGGAIVFFILIFAVVLAVFLRKPAANTAAPTPVTLTYWGLWEDKAVMDTVIADYKKLNPNVTIKYELMSPKEYRQKLIQRGRNGVGPDIFRFHNTWLPEIQDVAAPIPKEVMTNDEFEKTFYPIHKKDLAIGTDYYGIPLTIDGMVMVYNDNLFKKAGITSAPSNWIGDLLDDVIKLTVQDKNGDIVTSGIAMGTASNIEHFAEVYGILLLQNGGSLQTLDKKEAVDALKVYREFGEKNIWNDKMPNSVQAFAEQKVAIIIVPSWQILGIKAMNPDIPLKVAPVPRGLDGKPLSLASYWVEGVSKFSKNQVEAWKFLKYTSQKDSQEKLFAAQTKIRQFGSAYSRVDLKPKIEQDPILGPIVQQSDYYQTLPIAGRTFDAGLNDENIAYLQNAINSTTTGVSYEEALKTAHTGITQVINKYKIQTAPAQ
jgi:ABC-type glycerol-3-phosphate transport system substrate-binding protein